MDVFEAMETCRAMRYLKTAPVPDELVEKVLHAATRASNPGNSQGWAFVVVREDGGPGCGAVMDYAETEPGGIEFVGDFDSGEIPLHRAPRCRACRHPPAGRRHPARQHPQ